jgi:hypothetical protein
MEAHIDVERVADIAGLPADHPDRRHAENCPRCRSLLASYQLFVAAEPVAGDDSERAERVLEARIREGAERWIPAQAGKSALSRSPLRGLMRRPLFAVAAAVAVVAAAFLWTSRGPDAPVLREHTVREPIVLNPAVVDAGGTIHLSWSALPGADQYQVRIYGPDLGEIYRSEVTGETSLTIGRSALPAALPPTLDLTWRVHALAAGDVILMSPPGSVRVQ